MTDDLRRLEVEVAAGTATTTAGFDALNRRLDDFGAIQTQRHEDNMKRLERIEGEVRRTNGRVTTLEVREEDARSRGQERGPTAARMPPITLPTLRWWLILVGSGFAAAVWLLNEMGFHR